MTKAEYILECDVLLNRIYYKSDAPWNIEVKVTKNQETDTNRLQFNWVKDGTQHRVHLFSFDTPVKLDPEWEQNRLVTVTEVMSFMKEPEDYKFAIQCILSSEEFYEDLVVGIEPTFLEKLKLLEKVEYIFE